MRRVAFLLLLLPSLTVLAQDAPDAFEITQRFAGSGALQLALARVERMQPVSPSAPRWGDWELLRCSLLLQAGRHQELVQRVGALPGTTPDKVARYCLLQGARAAIEAGQGPAARGALARLIWRHELDAAELRQARLLVVESYLADGKPQEAYALMLRFQQDYKFADRETAARFVDALLASGMEQEAIVWFSQLDDASPVKLLLRLKGNLVMPEAAVAQARAQLATSANPAAWWYVLQHAALLQNNRALQLESLENLLQLADKRAVARISTLTQGLWEAYFAAAQEVANQNRLLLGDEAGLADFAARRAGAMPALARAFYAYLALKGKSTETRYSAQLQLVYALQTSKLGLVALRLYGDTARFPVSQIDAQARFMLGSIAAENNLPVAAAGYWRGLQPPPTLGPDEWQLQLAQVLVRGGFATPGADALRPLIAGRKQLSADKVQRVLAMTQDLQDAGYDKTADELYRELLPLAQPAQKREILYGLGKIAESINDFARAADHFLEAALLPDPRPNDTFGFNARLLAAVNLGRAGFKEDARAQLQSLQKGTKDAAQLELLRRELRKL